MDEFLKTLIRQYEEACDARAWRECDRIRVAIDTYMRQARLGVVHG